ATSYDDREVGAYSLSVNLPTLSSLSPRLRGANVVVPVTLTGNNFSSPMTVDAGAGITVTNINVASATSATATFSISSNAALGIRNVTATTSAGTTNTASFRVFPEVPLIAPGDRVTGSLANTDAITTDP